jgi:hypothetical protein
MSADRSPWQTPAIEPVTDVSATADQTAPMRNGNLSSFTPR